jgi:outer membrane protein assembly factor BamB
VFVTSCREDEGKRVLLCLDRREGKTKWERTVVTAKLEGKHRENSFSSATPATDGKHVYVAFLDVDMMLVACYDVDGKELWRVKPGPFKSVHGFCTSPVLHKDLVIVNGDADHKDSFLAALDRNTGKQVWHVERPNHIRSYCTPILIRTEKNPEMTQLVLSGSKTVTGYEADTGKLLWIHNGPTEQYVASLVYDQDILCLTTGFPEFHLMGISPHGHGDITKSANVVWHIPHDNKLRGKNASYVPSPIAANGMFFIVSDTGMLSCVDARTGERHYLEQLGRHFHASPIRVEGHLLFIDDDGICSIVKPGPKFEVMRKIEMGEPCNASPAVSHGHLFIRTQSSLYCIGAPTK